MGEGIPREQEPQKEVNTLDDVEDFDNLYELIRKKQQNQEMANQIIEIIETARNSSAPELEKLKPNLRNKVTELLKKSDLLEKNQKNEALTLLESRNLFNEIKNKMEICPEIYRSFLIKHANNIDLLFDKYEKIPTSERSKFGISEKEGDLLWKMLRELRLMQHQIRSAYQSTSNKDINIIDEKISLLINIG